MWFSAIGSIKCLKLHTTGFSHMSTTHSTEPEPGMLPKSQKGRLLRIIKKIQQHVVITQFHYVNWIKQN